MLGQGQGQPGLPGGVAICQRRHYNHVDGTACHAQGHAALVTGASSGGDAGSGPCIVEGQAAAGRGSGAGVWVGGGQGRAP